MNQDDHCLRRRLGAFAVLGAAAGAASAAALILATPAFADPTDDAVAAASTTVGTTGGELGSFNADLTNFLDAVETFVDQHLPGIEKYLLNTGIFESTSATNGASAAAFVGTTGGGGTTPPPTELSLLDTALGNDGASPLAIQDENNFFSAPSPADPNPTGLETALVSDLNADPTIFDTRVLVDPLDFLAAHPPSDPFDPALDPHLLLGSVFGLDEGFLFLSSVISGAGAF
jgi:hypothetical protein